MDVMEAILNRRSTRNFDTRSVPDELLDQVLRAGAASPSGGNLQAWGFVLVTDPKQLAGLRSLAPGIIGRPAATVAICLDTGRANLLGGRGAGSMVWIDAGVALQSMLLSAHACGLGACPIGSFHSEAVTLFLGLPEGIRPVLLLTLGFPKARPPSPGRRPLMDVCFLGKWGVPWTKR